MEKIVTFGFSALSHHIMIIIEGSVYTWGWNSKGQLGYETITNSMDNNKPNKPNKIQNLDNVVSVAWGLYHSMAMTQDGDVYLWGCNENGELGDGTTENSTTPKKLNILENIKMIACSYEHNSMFVTNDGDVYCWGKNDVGQLGNGSTDQSTTPQKINNLTNIAKISCGHQYSIAITERGDVYSWGFNEFGQLGNGSTTNSTVPQKINNLTNVTTIACGEGHALALMSCGDVYSWGYNGKGQLGNGNTNNTSTPQKIPNLVNIVAISCGYHHSMALTRDGDVYSWGCNDEGQLGVGSTTDSSTPLKVNITDRVCTIACVGENSMVFTNGHIFVWGYNYDRQLCNGTVTISTTPQKLDLLPGTFYLSRPSPTVQPLLNRQPAPTLPIAQQDKQRVNIRVMDELPSPTLSFGPIHGISDINVTSIVEAITPLVTNNLVKHIDKYTQDALNLFSEKPLPTALDLHETVAIHLYTKEWPEQTCSLYYVLNANLRSRDRSMIKPFYPYIKILLTGLAKLKKAPGITFRGIGINLSNDYAIGKTIEWWSFTSTSIDGNACQNFLEKSSERTLFRLEQKSGVNIQMFSNYPEESEVLLCPMKVLVKSNFLVVKGLWYVDLVEIEDPLVNL